MPVSKSDQSSAKICKFCDESPHCRIWNIKFDQDILHIIKKKFPSWLLPLKNKSKYSIRCSTWLTTSDTNIMSEASGSKSSYCGIDQQEKRISPPKAIVDSSPLQSAMDKNRESLKVKLLVRRSANQLVEQGILPPLKTSPAIHEQRKLLERAKTGDLLKAKIQQRPARQELERRHILESHEGHIDPSLADKYRMLEKAILVDQLNSKISHRPGPLELINKNILHANEPIERIVKEGLVPFKVSNEDNLAEKNFLSFEDDSQSSETDLFQHSSQVQGHVVLASELEHKSKDVCAGTQEKHLFESLPTTSTGVINISLVPTSNMLSTGAAPISVATFKIQSAEKNGMNIPPPPPPPKLITYHVKPMLQTQVKGLINTQSFVPVQIMPEAPMMPMTVLPPTAVNQHVSSFIQNNNQKFSAPGKDKNRKKCKNKAVSKARAIKFHEYKGPPNKSSSMSSSSSASIAASKKLGETNYELIMQQQCLLEYLEGIYKNPHAQAQAIKSESEYLKDATKPIKIEKTPENGHDVTKTFNKPHVTIFPSKPSAQSSPSSLQEISKDVNVTDVGKLSKMKVSELKAYLKRVNLPVSGPKPLLIERLKPYLPLKPLNDDCSEETSISSNMMSEGNDFYNASLPSVSSTESDMDNMDAQQCLSLSVESINKDDDIVLEQQRKIEELQRKLQQSQHELEQMKQHKVEVPAQQKIVFDPQYQLPGQISTVFVVDVSQAATSSDDCIATASPVKVKTEMLLESSPSANLHPKITVVRNLLEADGMSEEEKEPNQINKEALLTAASNNVIPMSQDITDVLEILLKNGEWPDMSDDVKGIDGNFIHNSNDASAFSNDNILSSKHFIGEVLAGHNPFDVMSPMNEDPVSPILQVTEESIDKILDNVSPSSESILHGGFASPFAHDSFPMDIEDDPLVNTDFNRNVFQNAEFSSKPHQNMQPYFNGLKLENCDTKYSGYSGKSSQDKSPTIKSEFPETGLLPKSQKNGLIGNFDHNLFDTLKNNNINNNSCNSVMNELFLIPQDGKYAGKDDSKSLTNNLHLSNNFDMFSTAMDFESIIPYNDLQAHDSLFQISGFDSAIGRGGAFNDHSNSLLFNDDTRMSNLSNGDGNMSNMNMNVEVDNLLCNL